jgi:hemoglobin/transferrin/lactoferrin receptor protein
MRLSMCLAVLALLLAANTAAAAEASSSQTAEEALPVIRVDAEREEAAGAAEDRPVELEPITTVGTRTPRDPLDLPASVSIVTAREIDERQLSDLGETLGGLAGVSIAGGPRVNAESINIRGLSGTRVLLSVDGARQNFDGAHRSRLYVDPELLKSVDLLRGPASALWGSDALGGVVAMETKDAADLLREGERFGVRLKTGFEQASDERLAGATGFGRTGDFDWVAHVASRDSGQIEQGNGERIPHSALETGSGLYKATWLPGDDHTVGVSFQSYFQNGESPSNPAQEVDEDNPLLARGNDQNYLTARYGYSGDGRIAGANVTAYRTALGIVEDRVDRYRHDTLDFTTQGLSAHTSLRFEPLTQRLTLGVEGYRDASEAKRNGAPRPQFPDAQRDVLGAFVQDEIGLGRGCPSFPVCVMTVSRRARTRTPQARPSGSDSRPSWPLPTTWPNGCRCMPGTPRRFARRRCSRPTPPARTSWATSFAPTPSCGRSRRPMSRPGCN